MTPAIVTETLYGLLRKNITAGDIHIVTTAQGAQRHTLPDTAKPNTSLKSLIQEFNGDYDTEWRVSKIDVVCDSQGQPLDDIRDKAANDAAANHITRRVWELTQIPSNTHDRAA